LTNYPENEVKQNKILKKNNDPTAGLNREPEMQQARDSNCATMQLSGCVLKHP